MTIKTVITRILICTSLMTIAQSAHAQLTIELGGNVADIKRALLQQGYTRIDFTGRGFTKYRAQACKDGKRWAFKVDWRGKTNDRKVIGKCRTFIEEAEAFRILENAGYRRINMENQNGMFVAIACRQDRRFRIELNQYGDIRKERGLGRCVQDMSPTDIEAKLKNEGYDRFKWIDRQLPQYVAEVCLDTQRLELSLDREGNLISQRQIGQCGRQISPAEIPVVLTERGYSRIKVTDDRLPRYGAIACRGDRKVELTLNRYGRITDEVAIGRCQREMQLDEIIRYVQDQGFTRVRFLGQTTTGYTLSACHSDERYRFTLSRYGELSDEQAQGKCTSPNMFNLIDGVENQGIIGARIYVEGCSRGRQVRIEYSEFGDELGRETVGSCRTLNAPMKN